MPPNKTPDEKNKQGSINSSHYKSFFSRCKSNAVTILNGCFSCRKHEERSFSPPISHLKRILCYKTGDVIDEAQLTSTQVAQTISDDVYRRAQRIAPSRQGDVAEVLAESIVLRDDLDETASLASEATIERERAAYLAMHATLLEKYKGEYVAIYQEKLVDHDPDFSMLYKRIDQQYADVFVLIR